MRELGGDLQQQRSHKEIATLHLRATKTAPRLEVVRFFQKTFDSSRLDRRASAWKGGMGDTRRVPYRLPELLLSAEVIVVEGEKTSTSRHANGSRRDLQSRWRGQVAREVRSMSEGQLVYVIPHQDKQDASTRRCRSLPRGVARSIMIVTLPEEVKDVAEFALANGQVFLEKLDALLEEARPFELPTTTTEDPLASDDDDPRDYSRKQSEDEKIRRSLIPSRPVVDALRKIRTQRQRLRKLKLKRRACLLDEFARATRASSTRDAASERRGSGG